jgi:hypothetical protein
MNNSNSLPTIIDAYKLMGHFAQESLTLNFPDNAQHFQVQLDKYLSGLLSGVPESTRAIGKRWVNSQTKTTNLTSLKDAIQVADASNPKQIVKSAVLESSKSLPSNKISPRFILFLGDGENKTLTQAMQYAIGVSLGSEVTLIFFWPEHQWQTSLFYITAHEYFHLARNVIFEQFFTGQTMVNISSQKPDSLLDIILSEGLADTFAMSISDSHVPNWLNSFNEIEEKRAWEKILPHLDSTNPELIRGVLSGSQGNLPDWAGNFIGYLIVNSYLTTNPTVKIQDLVSIEYSEIFKNSNYTAGIPRRG